MSSTRICAPAVMVAMMLLSAPAMADENADNGEGDSVAIAMMAIGGVGAAAGAFLTVGNLGTMATFALSGLASPLFYYWSIGGLAFSVMLIGLNLGLLAFGANRYSESANGGSPPAPYSDPEEAARERQSRILDRYYPKTDSEKTEPRETHDAVIDRSRRKTKKKTKKQKELAARKAKARRCINVEFERNADLSDDGLDLLCGAHLNSKGAVVFPKP